MEVILIALILVLIGFMALCWVQRDKLQELNQKYISVSEDNKRLQQECRKQELRADELANKLHYEPQGIICYTCGDNGDCTEGCRFTLGATGCKKYRRYE